MNQQRSITSILVAHFFRRFFDNDTLQADGDTQTSVIRAVSIVAVPGMMFAFFLQNQYPGRPLWAGIADRYFFVLFSFFVLGIVAVFEWDMLFPDRLDFLVLTPLSLRPVQMLVSKALALAAFLFVFLFGTNMFGTIMLPVVSRATFFRHVYAHAVAVSLAGAFAALAVLALGGVLLCLLDAARFRFASPILQSLSTMALLLVFLHGIVLGNSVPALLLSGKARFVPPLWFLGLYEKLLLGNAAPPFAEQMTRYALRGTALVAAIVLLTYPLAWKRRSKAAIEGTSRHHLHPLTWLTKLIHALIRQPSERAVFHFIGQTLMRNNRYQVYLAMYCGSGLALAIVSAVRVLPGPNSIHIALSQRGMHAVLPLLLFWLISGLRMAFAFPLNLSARWVFRLTGAGVTGAAAAARKWALLCACALASFGIAALHLAGWSGRVLVIQAVCACCLCIVLTDAFFSLHPGVPFNRPRMPGRTSFPLMLTLYVGILPVFLLWGITLELEIERDPVKLLVPILATAAIHAALAALRRLPPEIEEEMEGYEGEFQLLGLS